MKNRRIAAPIITRVRPSAKIPEAASFIRERVDAGRQVYIIYPVIEESETLSVKAATTEYPKWEKLLAPLRCGLLHGRLTPDEKERVMEAISRRSDRRPGFDNSDRGGRRCSECDGDVD